MLCVKLLLALLCVFTGSHMAFIGCDTPTIPGTTHFYALKYAPPFKSIEKFRRMGMCFVLAWPGMPKPNSRLQQRSKTQLITSDEESACPHRVRLIWRIQTSQITTSQPHLTHAHKQSWRLDLDFPPIRCRLNHEEILLLNCLPACGFTCGLSRI